MNTCKKNNKIRYWNEKQSVQIVQAALFVYTRSIANLAAMALYLLQNGMKKSTCRSKCKSDYLFP